VDIPADYLCFNEQTSWTATGRRLILSQIVSCLESPASLKAPRPGLLRPKIRGAKARRHQLRLVICIILASEVQDAVKWRAKHRLDTGLCEYKTRGFQKQEQVNYPNYARLQFASLRKACTAPVVTGQRQPQRMSGDGASS
jgi:hypothetical protein